MMDQWCYLTRQQNASVNCMLITASLSPYWKRRVASAARANRSPAQEVLAYRNIDIFVAEPIETEPIFALANK